MWGPRASDTRPVSPLSALQNRRNCESVGCETHDSIKSSDCGGELETVKCHCYVTPGAYTLPSVSHLQKHFKRKPQHFCLPCGHFPAGRRPAPAFDSSAEGLAAASQSQSILLYLEAFSSFPQGISAVGRSQSCTLCLVRCGVLRD